MNRKFIAVLVVLALLATALVVVAEVVNVSGTLDDSNPQTGRIFRDGIPSDCSGKAYPGLYDNGEDYYIVEGGWTVSEDTCVTVNWDEGSCGLYAHPSAYVGGYDPADQAAGFVGDPGTSATGSFSFPLSEGDTFYIVVQSTYNADSLPCSYSFDFDAPLQAEEPTEEPEEPTEEPVYQRWDPGDARINPQPAMEVAIYCVADGIDLWGFSNMHYGYVSLAAFDAAPATDDAPFFTSDDGTVRVYHLANGWWGVQKDQVRGDAVETYQFAWDTCPPTMTQTTVYDAAGNLLVYEVGP